jgi:phosphoribosylformylglycinamidine synthase subunit PurQ / glutaminase
VKFGIVVFPGSNCDQDCYHVAKDLLGCEADYVWHRDTDLKGADVVILPGGFAYGDYLRAGALARFSPVMESVAKFAGEGGLVLGICNGFQVLLEAGMLPGAVRVNRGLRYVCRDIYLRVENPDTAFTRLYEKGAVIRMPIGHMEGNYTAPLPTLEALEGEGRIVFRYCDSEGRVLDAANPNGAEHAIAGICNSAGNVVGLMPHPDRCSEALLGNDVGRKMFESVVETLAGARHP